MAILAASYGEGETVCAVARRHGLTPQQLFTWRRLARGEPTSEAPATFVPAVGDDAARADRCGHSAASGSSAVGGATTTAHSLSLGATVTLDEL